MHSWIVPRVRLREEMTLVKMAKHSSELDELDVEGSREYLAYAGMISRWRAVAPSTPSSGIERSKVAKRAFRWRARASR
jgi:hypothetical protein